MIVSQTDPSICECKASHYISGDTCLPCHDLCSVCDTDAFCTECDNPVTMMISESDPTTCECKSNTYLTGDDCTPCGSLCSTCGTDAGCTVCMDPINMIISTSDPTTCECKDGTYLDGDTCVACNSLCSVCDGNGECTKCKDSLNMIISQADPSVCVCKPNYYLNIDTCESCNSLCSTCSSSNPCTSCVDNASTTNNKCTCKTGYFESDNSCKNCADLCSTCSSLSVCTSCTSNASLNSGSQCVCNTGFSDQNGSCIAICNQLCTKCDTNNGNSCSSCVQNAELLIDQCSCTQNSQYNSNLGYCTCNSDYTLVQSKCVICKNYFASSDITSAQFTSTLTSILVSFKADIDTSQDASCSKTIDAQSLSKLGVDPVCSWSNSRTLRILLGSSYTIRLETLYLDGTNILKRVGPCTIGYQVLSETVTLIQEPTIAPVITGVSSFSLACGSSPLVFTSEKSTGRGGLSFTYAWASVISPSNSALSSYISQQAGSSISIDRAYFSPNVITSVTVSLTLRNGFGYSNSTSFITTVDPAQMLSLSLDTGSSVSMLSSESKEIKASINTLCGDNTNPISWTWGYVEGSITIDSDSILQESKSLNKLFIKNKMLPPSGSFIFRVFAVQESESGTSLTGNTTVTIKTLQSPLYIELSKSDGEISPMFDFTVHGSNSKDPDDATTVLNYEWSCLSLDLISPCLDSTGDALVSNQIEAELTFTSSKLTKGDSYVITLRIWADTRDKSATITITVLEEEITTQVFLPYTTEKVNPQNVFTMVTVLDVSDAISLKWSQISGQSVVISPDFLSTASFPAGTLSEGESYTFQLEILEGLTGNTLKISIPITTNFGPYCDSSVSISPNTGNALQTKFEISIQNCADRDEEDYPITYRYLDI